MKKKLFPFLHGYFNNDVERVWNVIVKDIPALKKQIEDIIHKEN